jgi:hypothetical protein
MDYDKVVEQICCYDGPRNQTRDIFMYSMREYQRKILERIEFITNNSETTIRVRKPHAYIYECLFNITILSLDYLSKTKSKKEIMKENRELYMRKNADYGNSFEDFAWIGLLVRLNDKINRILCLMDSGNIKVKDERVEDTIQDLYNYGILSLMYKNAS